MAGINKSELWHELDATDEAFVRRKQAVGGYGATKGKVVAQWLAAKDAERHAAAARTTALWTKVGAIAATVGVLTTIGFTLLSKAPV